MIVEHDFCDLLADAAPVEPEKVQLVALLRRLAAGGGVMAGAATGSATGEQVASPAKATRRGTTDAIMMATTVDKQGLDPRQSLPLCLLLAVDVIVNKLGLYSHVMGYEL